MDAKGLGDTHDIPREIQSQLGSDHVSVLLDEVVQFGRELCGDAIGTYIVDGTVGEAGHAVELARLSGVRAVYGFDRDQLALVRARQKLENNSASVESLDVELIHESYASADAAILRAHKLGYQAFFLLDLGIGSHQFESGGRGFSYRFPAEEFDMRFDASQGAPAWQLILKSGPRDVESWLKKYGEIRRARKIAAQLVEAAQEGAKTVGAFLQALDERTTRDPKELARIFQAIRIAVNDELAQLETILDKIESLLSAHPELKLRFAVISFHSLEDRLVKQTFRRWQDPCECPPRIPMCICGKKSLGHTPVRKAIQPSEGEIKRNSRSRSARLRIFDSIAVGDARKAA